MQQKLLGFYWILFLFSTSISAQHMAAHQADKPATHGMLIFGTEKIYASHLPMFHSPHHYQVLLELNLTPADKKRFITDQQLHREVPSYTIEPEKFVLPHMLANPRPFKANLYRGHFERGGIKIASNIVVNISSIIYLQQFKPDAIKDTVAHFILFGNHKEQFAVHQISKQPDFEQIMQVKYAPVLLQVKQPFLLATFNSLNHPVGVSGNQIAMQVSGKTQTIHLLKLLYLEFDDLLH